MSHAIKHTQLTGIGYRYQDLMGIQLLLQWIENPSLYQWVKFESADLDDYKVNGLDDVIAKTADGDYLLHQVKFSIDAKRFDLALTFNWLLAIKGRGTSFIQKWGTSFFNVPTHKIAEAKLLTNRRPDEQFMSCLNGKILDFEKLPQGVQADFVKQLGDEEKARLFLSKFIFEHSQNDIENLSLTLEENFCRNHTDRYGWLQLCDEVWKWAALKEYPDGSGKIRIHHVRELLNHKLARAMPQEFAIPDGYLPPTDQFHKGFLNKCSNVSNGEVEVLWGSPGRGKSTYLSYLVKCLTEQGIHVLRHHFFLSLTDDTLGRWEYRNVVSSLIHQIGLVFKDIEVPRGDSNISGKLRALLENAAQKVKLDNKPLILVMDGLDHVYREHGEIHSLNLLFDELFPLPDNVILLVGTQKVQDEKLPRKLLLNKGKDTWTEIPLLNIEVIKPWMKTELNKIGHVAANDETKLTELSTAILDKSAGHPLYLTYSINSLVIKHPIFDVEQILLLPECPDGEIEKYYSLLWLELSNGARTILHVFALSGFLWPDKNSLVECFGSPIETLEAYSEIEHLVEKRAIGIKVFHGSILVFCREQDSSKDIASALYPSIIEWVEGNASDLIKRSWLWLLEAENGNGADLIDKPTRDWVSSSLLCGVTQNQILHLLAIAEENALIEKKYARTLELKIIKTRLEGTDYAGQEYEQLMALSLALPTNFNALKYALDDLHSMTEADLLTAARAGFLRNENIAADCLEEMNRRINISINFKQDRFHERSYDPCSVAAIAALSASSKIDKIIPFAVQYDEESQIIYTFMKELLRFAKSSHCIEMLEYGEFLVAGQKITMQSHRLIGILGVRAMFLEGISIEKNETLVKFKLVPFVACALSINDNTVSPPPVPLSFSTESYGAKFDDDIYYDHFFSSLWTLKNVVGEFAFFSRQTSEDKTGFVKKAFEALDECAEFAIECINDKEILDPLYFYALLWNIFPKDGFKGREAYDFKNSLSRVLPKIALDLSILSGWKQAKYKIGTEEFDRLNGNLWWNWELWTAFALQFGLNYCTQETAKEIVRLANEDIEFISSSIGETADSQVKVSLWQFHNALYEDCAESMYTTHRNFTGYGFRKDPTMDDLLETLEHLLNHEIDIFPWLIRIERIVLNILEFTDGKGTKHTPEMYLDLIAKVMPNRLFVLYCIEQEKENWHNCEHILLLLARFGDYNCEDTCALICTAGEYGIYQEIQQKVKLGVPLAVELFDQYVSIWGHYHSAPIKDTGGTSFHDVEPKIDVSKFGPNKLVELLDVLNSLDRTDLPEHHHFKPEISIQKWFSFWGKAGEITTILKTLNTYLDDVEHVGSDVSRSLGSLFEVVLKDLGKSEAFKIIVLEHRLNHGWQSYYTSGTKKRLEQVAEIYSDRWEEYIMETSVPIDNSWGRKFGLSIGSELLVYFLLEVDQKEIAEDVVNVMVTQIEQDVEMLDLKKVEWPDD